MPFLTPAALFMRATNAKVVHVASQKERMHVRYSSSRKTCDFACFLLESTHEQEILQLWMHKNEAKESSSAIFHLEWCALSYPQVPFSQVQWMWEQSIQAECTIIQEKRSHIRHSLLTDECSHSLYTFHKDCSSVWKAVKIHHVNETKPMLGMQIFLLQQTR